MKTLVMTALTMLLFGGAAPANLSQNTTTYVCTLTNEKVTSCCCEKRNGKLFCTKAKKEINTCCCKPVQE